jgi:hypothetical protein
MQRKQTLLLIATALTVAATMWSEERPDVPYPEGFRSWQHVITDVVGKENQTFATRGGIHHFYANAKAVEGYRTGKFPNGSILVDEGVFAKEGEGQAKGMLLEGERRSVDVMVKNDQLYQQTGGWGFEHFDRDNKTGVLTADIRAQCHACHSTQKDRDHVFTKIRP